MQTAPEKRSRKTHVTKQQGRAWDAAARKNAPLRIRGADALGA